MVMVVQIHKLRRKKKSVDQSSVLIVLKKSVQLFKKILIIKVIIFTTAKHKTNSKRLQISIVQGLKTVR